MRISTAIGVLAMAAMSASAQPASTPTPSPDRLIQVKLETSKGDIVLELDSTKAPKTVASFLAYTKEGFYNGTIFHRVIKGFMIQGGGFTADMTQKKTKPPIPNEADNGLKNLHFTIAMARTSDPQSATAQFFINANDNHPLNFRGKSDALWGYCVFGKVIQGTAVVTAIESVATGSNGPFQDVPTEAVVIKKASVVK
jgi:peptidyl-prolyl cis-trans isomerase B (cyclophilin B)